MTINLHVPPKNETSLRPRITVIGVGGAGGNAVNNMISASLEGINFIVANTDAQALEHALAEKRIQLGTTVTQGLGAGAVPDVGRAAAEESLDEIAAHVQGSHMVFITAGMGGGTGTGAAPVIARLAREQGVLTVGVVTKPFQFEGAHRMRTAETGLKELQKYVDTLIVIPNQNLFRIANERTTFADAFKMADDVLHSGVRGVTDLMVMPGLINLDFADIRAVMGEMGKAMMGTGEAEGDKRAIEAAEAAISNPLLDDVSMKGAKGVLINITGGSDITLFEVDEAANRIREEVDPNANIIFGAIFNNGMEGKMRVSVVATGIEDAEELRQRAAAANAAIAQSQASRAAGQMQGQFSGHGGAGAAVSALQRQEAPRPTSTTPAHAQQGHTVHASAAQAAPGGTSNPAYATAPDGGASGQRTQETAGYTAAQDAGQGNNTASHAGGNSGTTLHHAGMNHSGGNGGGTMADGGEPRFIAPRPAQPAARATYVAGQAPAVAATSAGSAAGAFNLSNFMAGVGRAFAVRSEPRPEEYTAQQPEPAARPAPAPLTSVQGAGRQDNPQEYLDIPAFLRRQAN